MKKWIKGVLAVSALIVLMVFVFLLQGRSPLNGLRGHEITDEVTLIKSGHVHEESLTVRGNMTEVQQWLGADSLVASGWVKDEMSPAAMKAAGCRSFIALSKGPSGADEWDIVICEPIDAHGTIYVTERRPVALTERLAARLGLIPRE